MRCIPVLKAQSNSVYTYTSILLLAIYTMHKLSILYYNNTQMIVIVIINVKITGEYVRIEVNRAVAIFPSSGGASCNIIFFLLRIVHFIYYSNLFSNFLFLFLFKLMRYLVIQF